ncbi:MAG: cyclic nucleotide-binding domain-containing protein [Deltaproteobacteria bacterium]|jgi:pSer/pThr/pTyr-binding forkhead associated (FHA) protein|nr:cyclic nucleotide-binding domain-containing protein [Deltaproteobacteria bacterium]
MKRVYLVFQTGSHQQTVYPLLETTTIGRDSGNLIPLPDPTASRYHAKVHHQEGSWVIEDLGSTNGIMFSGKRVEKISLSPGDTFQIGKTSFVVVEREIKESKDSLQTTLEFVLPTSSVGTDRRSVRLMDVISKIPFFAPLQETESEELAEDATMHVFSAGEMIIREGDPGRSVYVILDGRVRVFTRDNGDNELELATLGVGQFFGEMSFISGEPRSSSVAALELSVVVELSYDSMAKVIEQNQTVKKVLEKYHKFRKKDTQEKLADMGLTKPELLP